jgi:hypothetical protein
VADAIEPIEGGVIIGLNFDEEIAGYKECVTFLLWMYVYMNASAIITVYLAELYRGEVTPKVYSDRRIASTSQSAFFEKKMGEYTHARPIFQPTHSRRCTHHHG